MLSALSPADLDLLEPQLETVELKTRTALESPQKTIERAYFFETGVASVVANTGRDERIDIGLIGCEGMAGMTVLMGDRRSPHLVVVQIPGEALAIPADALCTAARGSSALQNLLLRFARVFMVQAEQTAVANGRASLEQRLARWILMAHDRTVGNDVPLTHEFLSMMLGVRRASVTYAVHKFVKHELVSVRRGSMTIKNRNGIEQLAGSFYGIPEAEYRRLIGGP